MELTSTYNCLKKKEREEKPCKKGKMKNGENWTRIVNIFILLLFYVEKLIFVRKAYLKYLKILSQAKSLIANNNIRSVILGIRNDKCKININTNISFSLPTTFSKHIKF